MPGTLKVKVVSARGLPIMDRSTDLTDAFVEIKFGAEVQKTDVFKRSLNPQWNTEWFKFEVEDEVLQDEPLELRVLDHDTYSAHDAIGKVYIDLNPLLVKESPSVISGWFPVYDTMHGIRGDLNVIVKIDLFSDFNKFRQSSCGIQFFCTPEVPAGYRLQYVHGFVEELVVNDDPEYQWIDKIRTPRSSNEARQRLFSKMSGQLARKIGLKVLEMGGGAVIGYKQCFDLEGESGIVIRGIGTAVTLNKLRDPQVSPLGMSPLKDYQRPLVPALYVSTPIVISTNSSASHSRRSVHHAHSLTPPPSLIHSSDTAVTSTTGPVNHHPHVHTNGHNSNASHSGSVNCHSVSSVQQNVIGPHIDYASPSLSDTATQPSHSSSHAHTHSQHHSHNTCTNINKSHSLYNAHSASNAPNGEHLQSNQSQPLSTHQLSMQGSQSAHTQETTHFAFDFTYSSPAPEENLVPSPPPGHNARSTTSPVKVTGPRRSSDSDVSTPPKGNSLGGSSGSGSGSCAKNFPKLCSQQVNIELMEFPLFTMTTFPPGFIIHLGGVVAARSVKLLDKIHNPEEPETRDAWWNEIRTEIRSHTRAMGCHAVIGYVEETSICEEIILLSATGTAAKVNLNLDLTAQSSSSAQGVPSKPAPQQQTLVSAGDRTLLGPGMDKDRDLQQKKLYVDVNLANQVSQRLTGSSEEGSPKFNCSLCHIPYKPNSSPFPINLSQCASCRRRYVPDVLFTTINPPPEIQTLGKGALIQARVCRPKGNNKAEANAKEISDILPFVEYELHNQLMNKLKKQMLKELAAIVKIKDVDGSFYVIPLNGWLGAAAVNIRSMNGLFGLKMQFVVGQCMLIGLATGTGAFLAPLQAPPIPRLLGQITSEEENVTLQQIQSTIQDQLTRYRDLYQLNGVEMSLQHSPPSSHTDDSDDDSSDLDLSTNNRDTFVLEVDDTKDNAVEAMLEDIPYPVGMMLCNTDTYPGLASRALLSNLQMFTQVFRRKVDCQQRLKSDFKEIFESLFRRLFFKLRRMIPCVLCNINLSVGLPEQDEIEIVVTGMCVAVDDTPHSHNSSLCETPAMGVTPMSKISLRPGGVGASGENVDEMMFTMEEVTEGSAASANKVTRLKPEGMKKKSSQILNQYILGIEVTPLAYIPRAKIERYIGSYNFFFIRETSSVKEVGGVCGFLQKFITEVLAIIRAHVSSLGGNALVAYNMTQCVLMNNEHKNQSQCLINVCGDAVYVVREGEISAVVPEHARKHSDSPMFNT